MGFLDRLLGAEELESSAPPSAPPSPLSQATPTHTMTPDEQTIARYRYMLRTAPPDQLEAAHGEAFERLIPHQREQIATQLSQLLPSDAQPLCGDDSQCLARTATEAELRQPKVLWQALGGMENEVLTALAAGVVGSAAGSAFFAQHSHEDDFWQNAAGLAPPMFNQDARRWDDTEEPVVLPDADPLGDIKRTDGKHPIPDVGDVYDYF